MLSTHMPDALKFLVWSIWRLVPNLLQLRLPCARMRMPVVMYLRGVGGSGSDYTCFYVEMHREVRVQLSRIFSCMVNIPGYEL